MRIKNKILSGILALSAVACVSLGIAFQSDNNVTASAVSGLSVNALGDLQWTAVDGATSYEVSSAYGTLTTTDTKVNVGDAIMKAAKSARGFIFFLALRPVTAKRMLSFWLKKSQSSEFSPTKTTE